MIPEEEPTLNEMIAAARVTRSSNSVEKNRRRSYWNYHRDPQASIAANADWQRKNRERVNAKQRAYTARKRAAKKTAPIDP